MAQSTGTREQTDVQQFGDEIRAGMAQSTGTRERTDVQQFGDEIRAGMAQSNGKREQTHVQQFGDEIPFLSQNGLNQAKMATENALFN